MRPTTLGKISVNKLDQSKMARPFDLSPSSSTPFNTIYQIRKFSFFKKHNIKTSESTVAINNSLEIIQLFNELDINRLSDHIYGFA